MLFGVSGFFAPRVPAAPFQPPGTLGGDQLLRHRAAAPDARAAWSTSTCSTRARCAFRSARSTSKSGNFVYFDSRAPAHRRAPHHGERRAAARLSADRDRRRVLLGRRPGLEHAAAVRARPARPARPRLVFQVDLFAARGEMPANLGGGERAREGHPLLEPDAPERRPTSCAARRRCRRRAASSPSCRRRCATTPTPEAARRPAAARPRSTVVHLIYRSKHYESQSKDYEFSRASMLEHWAAGMTDTQTTLEDPRWLGARTPRPGRARVRHDVARRGAPPRPSPPALHRGRSHHEQPSCRARSHSSPAPRAASARTSPTSMRAKAPKVAIADLNMAAAQAARRAEGQAPAAMAVAAGRDRRRPGQRRRRRGGQGLGRGRHPGEQRRHPDRPSARGVPVRRVEEDARDPPRRRLPHHQGLPAAHVRVGPRRQRSSTWARCTRRKPRC